VVEEEEVKDPISAPDNCILDLFKGTE